MSASCIVCWLVLNEVLSLNAQEWVLSMNERYLMISSMKS